MQLLSGPPRAAVTVFPEMFDYQPHVLQVTDARLGMAKPKALMVVAHQRCRLLDQLRRRRSRRQQLVQFIRLGGHAHKLRSTTRKARARCRCGAPVSAPACSWPLRSADGSGRFRRMGHLTKQEQLVLCAIIGLLLVGWAVKTWRTANPPPLAVEQVKD